MRVFVEYTGLATSAARKRGEARRLLGTHRTVHQEIAATLGAARGRVTTAAVTATINPSR